MGVFIVVLVMGGAAVQPAWATAAVAQAAPASEAASAPALAASAASAVPAASAPQPAASAPPAHTVSNGFAVHWQSPPNRAPDDGVQVQRDGWRGMRVLITSSQGRGRAELRPRRGGWPSRVQLRFQYAPDKPFDTLEGLRLQVLNPAHQAGDEVPPLVPDGFGIWQREGGLWLDLPEGWLRGQQGLRVMWVDRYPP